MANYAKDYYQGQSGLASIFFKPLENFFYSIRRNYHGQGSKLWIDIGAGDGGFLRTVDAKKKIGVETSKVGLDLMKSAQLETMTSEQFLKTKRFEADTISFWHSLEHVKNPSEYLRSAKNNLSKNGRIIIGVPNIDSFEAKFFGKHWFHLAPGFHLWHFSPHSLEILLLEQGLRVEKIDYFSLEHGFSGLLQSFINWSSQTENVLHRLIKRSSDRKMPFRGFIWSAFWVSLGLPIIFVVWFIEAIFHKSGTIVVTAKL